MVIMRVYKVIIDSEAERDIYEIYSYLKQVMSQYGANKYIDAMMTEVKLLSVYAWIFQKSKSQTILNIHPEARRMLSHNKKWNYIFHIEDEIVVVDRILASSTISK